jgi:hypothetical protein
MAIQSLVWSIPAINTTMFSTSLLASLSAICVFFFPIFLDRFSYMVICSYHRTNRPPPPPPPPKLKGSLLLPVDVAVLVAAAPPPPPPPVAAAAVLPKLRPGRNDPVMRPLVSLLFCPVGCMRFCGIDGRLLIYWRTTTGPMISAKKMTSMRKYKIA